MGCVVKNQFECLPCGATWASELSIGHCGGCGRDHVATTPQKRLPLALEILAEHVDQCRRIIESVRPKAESVDA